MRNKKLPNGFRALAHYDQPEQGGNLDGQIDDRDAVFPRLLLWHDANHNGLSEVEELLPLPSLDVVSLALDIRNPSAPMSTAINSNTVLKWMTRSAGVSGVGRGMSF